MLNDYWPPEFLARMGGSLPRDYFCFDTETTGFSRTNSLIVEWGHATVRDGQVTNKMNMVINWFAGNLISHANLIKDLERTRRQMALQDKEYRFTPELLREEGVDPEEALPFIYKLCRQIQENDELFVAHNGWNYDATMLFAHFKQFDVGKFAWREDDILDTGAMIKSLHLLDHPRGRPQKGETLRAYFKRIIAWRLAGVKWGLDGPEVAKLDLCPYGVDPAAFHTAGNDALAVHGIVECLRDQAWGSTVKQSLRPQVAAPKGKRRRRQRNR